jgi:hypothetical protein
VGQEKGVPIITNKNQACFTKKSGCGLQEEELNRCAVETKVGAKHRFFN